MIAILNLLTNILITGTSLIGCVTIINKIGKFCKVIEENNEDGFKVAFDISMMDTIDDMNKCVESIGMITSNFNNILFIIYDISIGNKFIKKNKDGKIVICNKSKVFSGYKDKIDELNNKVKKYQEELNKIKKPKKTFKKDNKSDISSINSLSNKLHNASENISADESPDISTDSSTDSSADSSSISSPDISDDDMDNNDVINNKKKNEDFYL